MPMIIGALVAALANMLRQFLPGIVGRCLLVLGIGLTTHTVAMPALLALVQSKVSGMPAVFVAYFGALGIDVVVTMLLSTFLAVRAQRVFLSKLSGS